MAVRRGHILLVTLGVAAFLSFVVLGIAVMQAYQARQSAAQTANRQLIPALNAVFAGAQEATVALAGRRLGRLAPGDADTLQAEIAALPLPAGLSIDTVAVALDSAQVRAPVPVGATALAQTTDWPRISWVQEFPTEAARVDSLVPVRVRVVVTGDAIGRVAGEIVFGVGQVPGEQWVVQTDGVAELCVTPDTVTLFTSGRVMANGALTTRACDGSWRHHGELLGRDSLNGSRSGGAPNDFIVTPGVTAAFPAPLGVAGWRSAPTTALDAMAGRGTVLAGVGSTFLERTQQSATRAGLDECLDTIGACGGVGQFTPVLGIQRLNTDVGTAVTIACSGVLSVPDCTTQQAAGAWTYLERPGGATPYEWQGWFPDPRREDRCTATVGAQTIRTFRCPTNTHGIALDMSILPVVPGGLVLVRGREGSTPPGDYSEALLIRNADFVAGPLTIISEIPVFLEGTFNVVSPVKAVHIQAPMITVLPNEAPTQMQWATVWDSTPALVDAQPIRVDVAGFVAPLQVKAFTPVTVNAILRAPYASTVGMGGLYYGGTIQQIPAVLGDWSDVSLVINGAIRGTDVAAAATKFTDVFQPYGAEFSGLPTQQPKGRFLVYDAQRFGIGGAPPGSWSTATLPGGSGGLTRPAARQALARGGTGITVLLSPPRRFSRGVLP